MAKVNFDQIAQSVRCPTCGSTIIRKTSFEKKGIRQDALICDGCGEKFPKIGSTVCFLNETELKHISGFNDLYSNWGDHSSQDSLNRIKPWPFLTEFATSYQVNIIMKYIQNGRGSKLLDVGCGYGFDIKRIHNRYNEIDIYGCDPSCVLIEQAVRNNPDVSIVIASAERIPFPADFFESIISHEVIEHVSAPKLCVSEMSRVVKSEGTIIITTPNGDTLFERIIRPILRQWRNARKLKSTPTYTDLSLRRSTLKSHFREYGLTISCWTYNCPFYLELTKLSLRIPQLLKHFLNAFYPFFARLISCLPLINILLCDQMAIVLKKDSRILSIIKSPNITAVQNNLKS